jgi:hypothetical protein
MPHINIPSAIRITLNLFDLAESVPLHETARRIRNPIFETYQGFYLRCLEESIIQAAEEYQAWEL